jgi:intracellular sulfur oxidation DsrE/DsrF family protein
MRGLSRRTAVAAFALLFLVPAALAANTTTPQRPAVRRAHAELPAERHAKPHHLLIQVNQNDPAIMNLALNNATNVLEYYRSRGEEVNVDLVAYGPGLQMLRADTSPVKDRIKTLKEMAFPGKVQFSACNVTKEGMEKKEGHPITVLSEAAIVPSGVVHLMELQEKGWSYVRP